MRRAWTQIADDFDVYEDTLSNWRNRVGFPHSELAQISDADLRDYIEAFYHPQGGRDNQGESMLMASLTMSGFDVAWNRMRAMTRQVNPEGVEHRRKQRSNPIERVPYNVKNLNELWHMDQNEKLIIFGIVDGATRSILSMMVFDHKFAQRPLENFQRAINAYGVPRSVRFDNGTENTMTIRYMECLRGDSGAITGPSVHNIKIEHQWLHTAYNILNHYRDAFVNHCNKGNMNRNAKDQTTEQKYIYKYLLLSRVQASLDTNTDVWNQHKSKAFSPRATPLEKALELRQRGEYYEDLSNEDKAAALEDFLRQDYFEDEYEAIRHPDPAFIRPLYDIPFENMNELLFFEHHVPPLMPHHDLDSDLQLAWDHAFSVLDYIYTVRQQG